jgi:hypothetical protein
LDEKPVPPPEYAHIELSGNGFYASSTIKDFPLRDRKVLYGVLKIYMYFICYFTVTQMDIKI